MFGSASACFHVFVVVCLVLLCATTVNGHLASVCTATHAQRPQTVTFLFGTYHSSPSAGSSVPGEAHIRTPQGTVFDFDFDSFCEVPHDSSNYPDPPWPLETNVSFYRQRLQAHCTCSKLLDCGTYDEATGMCTSQTGDCPLINPMEMEIECYGRNFDVPASQGAWGRALNDNENGNCAYGAVTGSDFATHTRTWYTAQVDSIFSGVFEVWTTGTDVNLDPSSLYLREFGQHPCTMSETCLLYTSPSPRDRG